MANVREMPVARLLPNMLTLLALCSGLTSMRFALMGQYREAVIALVISCVLDVLDGRVARLLNIASKFGAELDSLSDLTCFGVAPGFVLYLWSLQDDPSGIGWIAVLVLAGCCALRLARFNTMLEDHSLPAWTKSFFTGVPAPAGAGLALMPLIYHLQFDEMLHVPSGVVAGWMIVVGVLMVSRVPTLSMKGRRIAPVLVAPVMAVACVIVAMLVTHPWLTLSLIGTLYFLMLPFGFISYRKRQMREEKNA